MGKGQRCAGWMNTSMAIAYLETELKITETQTPQWNVFANTFRVDKEKMRAFASRRRTNRAARR